MSICLGPLNLVPRRPQSTSTPWRPAMPIPCTGTKRCRMKAQSAETHFTFSAGWVNLAISSGFHRVRGVQLTRSLSTVYRFPPLFLRALPKPGCRHPDSATKPDMNVSVHPAPQQRGVCHAYLGNQSPWLFSYRDNVDVTVADCLSHRSLLAFWA